MSEVTELHNRALAEISASADLRQLDDLRVRYLGKKGEVTAQLKALGSMEPEQRKAHGQAVNALAIFDVGMRFLQPALINHFLVGMTCRAGLGDIQRVRFRLRV